MDNCDNRLVASAMLEQIAKPLQEILSKRHNAFMKDTSMDDLIRRANSKFYTALKEGRRLHQFFHDFEKCYDSISRRFLLAILRKVGMPQSYLNLVEAFFKNNKAFPMLREKTKISILMRNGLKQGTL